MKYSKPEVTVVQSASAGIQGMPKGTVHLDNIKTLTYTPDSAYEADE